MILLNIILLPQKLAVVDFISFQNFSNFERHFLWITLCISTKKMPLNAAFFCHNQHFNYLPIQVKVIKPLKIKYLQSSSQMLLTRSLVRDMLAPSFLYLWTAFLLQGLWHQIFLLKSRKKPSLSYQFRL